MKYALTLAADGRILSVTYPQYAPIGTALVGELPDGNVSEYRYIDGDFVYDPLPVEEVEEVENIDLQADTDAMLVDHEYRLTMLELGLTE